MNASLLWKDLLDKARSSSFELHTIPQNKSLPLWFHVTRDGSSLIISNAKENTPSVRLSNARRINFKDFEFVSQYYEPWARGESGIRQIISSKSQNTAYILPLIAEAAKLGV